jgi:site-specific DNA-cytosine methylase
MRTFGSLFSGVGGLDLALESCGLGPVRWQCDSDPAARAVLARRWPGVRIYDDVRHIDESAGRVEIICGGFPCQPTSFAGARKAQRDTRWLWPFFAAVVARLRPRVVFIENVPGLQSAGLRDVLADLAGLGFDAEWDRFWAADVGAPHLRERLFILAHTGGLGREEVGRVGILDAEPAPPGRHPYRCSGADAHPGFPPCRNHVDGWAGPQPSIRRDADGPSPRAQHRLHGNAAVPAQAALAWRTLMTRATGGVPEQRERAGTTTGRRGLGVQLPPSPPSQKA